MRDDPLLGRQLANFRVERAIGRGGMAQVYYGQDIKLERPVAIKVIDTRYRGNPAYAERFVREARTVATWRHENIIYIYYADDEDDLYYFVMEYIDGPDLGQLITQAAEAGELIPQVEVWRIGQAVAAALDYAHAQGVIHRDVKPSNVMVAHDGRVVLADFGLALDVAQGSLGEVFGSSHYIAPEQAHRSAAAVPQSDLYSLAVMLYEMLTGRVPFADPSPTAVALQHVTLPPPPPRTVNPNLSEAIEEVLLKALRKAPTERYQTGQALLTALSQAMQLAGDGLPSAAVTIPSAGETVALVAEVFPNESIIGGGVSTMPIPELRDATVSASVQAAVKAEDELIGQQLDEYQLEGLLGRGGMARVYRGLDVRLNRVVAIKVIDTPFRTDSDYLVRFEREAQAIAQLEHPNVVTVYRFGEANGLLYLAMRYIEGDNLETRLARYRDERRKIVPAEAGRIIREVCAALDYAHEKGVIHRDIKPSNIMLDKKERVILTDFGLALLTEEGTQGEIFGSPHYIAPEQAVSSAGAVPQSDLYAIGVILYEMFTGYLPFQGVKALDIAMLHLSQPPRPPRTLRPEISPALEAVILRTLAKEPGQRYPNGAALATALDEALHLTPVKEPSAPTRQSPIPPPPKSEPMILTPSVASPVVDNSVKFSAETVVERLPSPRLAEPQAALSPALLPESKRPMTYLNLIGVVIIILLTVIAFLLWRGSENNNLGINGTTTLVETEPLNTAVSEGITPPVTLSPLPPSATPTLISTNTPQPVIVVTATPLDTATATDTPTPSLPPEPQPVADSSGQFSETQGANNWAYYWSRGRNSFDWVAMTFDGSCWRTNNEENAVRICADAGHPGITGDIAWRWTSAVTGAVRVQVSARKLDTAGGDGVTLVVYHNTSPSQTWQLAADDAQGFVEDLEIEVAEGDFLFFVMQIGENSGNDLTAFQVQIYPL